MRQPRARLAVVVTMTITALCGLATLVGILPSGALAQNDAVAPGTYLVTSDLEPSTSYLRIFGLDVIGVGPLTADDDQSSWSIEVADAGTYRLRTGDKYLTRRGEADGDGGFVAGRFLDLLGSRPDSLSQQWTFEPADDGTYRIISAWWPADGALTRDTTLLEDGTTAPADSASLYSVQDWSSQQWSLLAAAEPPPAVVVARWSCLGPDGKVDVEIRNDGDAAVTYQLQVGGLAPRSVTVDTAGTTRSTATGRPDGDLVVRLSLDGVAVHTETLVIDCDPDDTEVTVLVSCLGGNGRVDTYLHNDGDVALDYNVTVAGLSPRHRTVAPSQTHRVSVTGRADGDLDVTVARGETTVLDDTVNVNCDIPTSSVPPTATTAPPVPTLAPPAPSPVGQVWDNVFRPPELDNPLVIDSLETLERYRAEWPAYDIFCSGDLYELDLLSADRDILIDLTAEPAPLRIPLVVFATRNVVVVGAEFDLAVQPGCEAGQLPTQPEEGGPLVPGLSLHPRVPSGAALRIANPLAAWIEGTYIKMNGIEADCMVANNGATQSQADALTERDWYVINSRCDGQEGASPGDLGGDGVHGDFLHFQGDGMFRDLVFENVVHLSGQNGVTANQRTPDGQGSGELVVRNYYFDYNPEWEVHGPDSPSGGVGFSILVGDASRISVENYHYRNVHDSCSGMVITFDDAPLRIGDPVTNCEPHDGFHKIAGNPQDPQGQPAPIADYLFADIDDLGSRYESPFGHLSP